MSLKGSKTTADYLPWNDMQVLTRKLFRDKDYAFAILIATGSYTGLRISDLKQLRWMDIQQSSLTLVEQKTKKTRTIHLHPDLVDFLLSIARELNPDPVTPLFSLSLQFTNRKLKRIATDYKLDLRISTHTLRKTFGRRIWSKHNYSEKSLVLLSQIFNHSSVAITKRYLGIRDAEIEDVYMNL